MPTASPTVCLNRLGRHGPAGTVECGKVWRRQMLEETSRALPSMVLHPVTAALFLLLVRAMMKTPHASGRLLLFIVWLRYVMQAYHELTYVSVGGISINA